MVFDCVFYSSWRELVACLHDVVGIIVTIWNLIVGVCKDEVAFVILQHLQGVSASQSV
jgi:hypothetical protein